jgi:excisionase family DNA binding protein
MTRRHPSGAESEHRTSADRSERLFRPPEVAQLLACSSKTVYAWVASGFLPCVRLGRLVRFRAEDVRRFAEAHVETSQAVGRS